MTKCDYVHTIRKVDGVDVLLIEDMDLGRMSVTNDIENVLSELKDLYRGLPKIIIYRDSEGIWDGVNNNGEWVNFYMLNTQDTEVAIEKAIKLISA
jgi:hypothetical protein